MILTGTDQLWVADITYIRLAEEFVYLAVVLDAYSRRVIGWNFGEDAGDTLEPGGPGDGAAAPSAVTGCQGRSENRPLRRRKSRPLWAGREWLSFGLGGGWSGALRRPSGRRV